MKYVILLSDGEGTASPALLEALRAAGVAASTCVVADGDGAPLSPAVDLRSPFAILCEVGPGLEACAALAAAYAAAAWPRAPLVACRREQHDEGVGEEIELRSPDAATLGRLGFSAVADDPAQLAAILHELERAGTENDLPVPEGEGAQAPADLALPAKLSARQLRAAYAVAASLHFAGDQAGAASAALGGLAELVRADGWAIYLAGCAAPGAHKEVILELLAARGVSATGAAPAGASKVAREALASAEALRASEGGHHYLAVPLVAGERALGVLESARGAARKPFDAAKAALVAALAAPLAAALANSTRVAEAERLSQTDDLTKLNNARFLRQFLIAEVKRARRYGSTVSTVFLDLDDFKQVNDRQGHLVGSHVLMELAAVILTCVRDTDVVARYGGDEFVFVLPETNLEQASRVAERLRERISGHAFTGGRPHLRLTLTASFGVANFPRDAQSPQQLVAAADAAMYRAKASRKNRVCYASPPAQEAELKSL